jgi:chlorite dismutase
MRAKKFYVLPEEKQKTILGEHGTLAKRYGAGGHATDVRLACHGLDRDDNDFVIGLLGPNLHPLSAVVQEMRRTEQTSQYLDRLGPFFIGKVIWQSEFTRA